MIAKLEQAQAIAEIKERHGWLVLTDENETQPGDGLQAHEDRAALLEIVDSQAQKIARLEYTVSDKSDMLTGVAGLHKEACEEIEKQAQKIAEQAKKMRS